MAGRRGVDDHHLEPRGETDDLDEADQLVDARHGEPEHRVDIVPVEPRAVLDDVRERRAVGGEPARKGPRRVEFRRAQSAAGAADAGGPGRQLRAKCVAERVRGIGREDEDAAAAARRAECIGGGTGRLPDAALAAEEAKRRTIRLPPR